LENLYELVSGIWDGWLRWLLVVAGQNLKEWASMEKNPKTTAEEGSTDFGRGFDVTIFKMTLSPMEHGKR